MTGVAVRARLRGPSREATAPPAGRVLAADNLRSLVVGQREPEFAERTHHGPAVGGVLLDEPIGILSRVGQTVKYSARLAYAEVSDATAFQDVRISSAGAEQEPEQNHHRGPDGNAPSRRRGRSKARPVGPCRRAQKPTRAFSSNLTTRCGSDESLPGHQRLLCVQARGPGHRRSRRDR